MLTSSPRILALDPGLRTFGGAVLSAGGQILDAGALKTPPEDVAGKGTAVKQGARERQITAAWAWLTSWWRWKPAAIAAEATEEHALGNAAAVVSVVAGSTLVALLGHEFGIPIAWVTPREWRRYFVPEPAPRMSKPKRPSGKAIARHVHTCTACRTRIAASRAIPGMVGVAIECATYPKTKPARAVPNPMPTDAELYGAIGTAAAAAVRTALERRAQPASLDVHALDGVGIGRWGIARSAVVRRALAISEDGL